MVHFIKPSDTATKVKRTTAAKGSRKSARSMNGLATFALHANEPGARRAFAAAARSAPGPAALAAAAPEGYKATDPETAARHHLDAALASKDIKAFTRPVSDGTESEFKTINVEAAPLTGTTVVKFRQTVNSIPVYGSLVSVELDENQNCLGINSSLGTPSGVKSIAKASPADAIAVAAKESGTAAAKITTPPKLYYYFDQQHAKWHLAYIVEDVPVRKREVLADGRSDSALKDYIVDALSGKLIAALPRTPLMADEAAFDGLNASRTITVDTPTGSRRELRDTTLNVTTYDFGFKDPTASFTQLPGNIVALPPKPWAGEAVSAHANAEEVARFLRLVVKRNNIDGSGGEMTSSVNCWDRSEGTTPKKQWKNAYWNGRQMVYGQIATNNGFFSIANMLEVVGHEMFHGVTDHTSRLEYQTQAGALNESYSDIFGVIIANRPKPIDQWRWEIGVGFDGPGTALRDMQDPTRHGQPKHMNKFRSVTLPARNNDYGFVHGNSGIHNFAAFKVITAKKGGNFVFTPDDVAALFYIALTVHLSRTSQFGDSRRAVVQAARTLFRNDPQATQNAKVKAIEDGFSAAGIS